MSRVARKKPRDLTSDWPGGISEDPIGEVGRQLAERLKVSIGSRSLRDVGQACGVDHTTLLGILDGSTWPDAATIAKIERGLDADIWPGRIR